MPPSPSSRFCRGRGLTWRQWCPESWLRRAVSGFLFCRTVRPAFLRGRGTSASRHLPFLHARVPLELRLHVARAHVVVVPEPAAESARYVHQLVDYRFHLLTLRLPVELFGDELDDVKALLV